MNKFYNMFKSVAVNKAYAMARTASQDPLQGFRFKVNIEGLTSQMGFQKVGGLSKEIAVVEYLEAMYDHTHKLPGRETVGEITFERGMYETNEGMKLYEKVITASEGDYRTTVTISIVDRFGKIRRTFKCAECWFSKYELADLDATSDDVLIETLTMQFEYFL